MKRIFIFSLIIVTTLISGCSILTRQVKTNDISEYSKYYGENINNIDNKIFPKDIPNSSEIEKFTYEFAGIIDESVVSHLVYTCNDKEFETEINRLAKLDSSVDCLIYGATGFKYPVAVVHADERGYTYALSDDKNNKLIYVQINFNDGFCGIDYEDRVKEEYLPINFNAKPDWQ